uniref:LamG-like jellyroll fold domain-containing protein n=1 Tax=viral metagenome TaxID=1070528 RepID=A0A6C0AVX8_9ZZZZ|tara:strand:+ start:9101 stop:9799 length:699 start_codon:yes stop_codon:yes gene_type:complete
MEPKSIIIVVLVLLLLYIIIRTVTYPSGLTSKTDAKTLQTISADDLESGDTASVNFSYSIWFYVDDWNYKYGQAKVIFGRLDMNKKPCPTIVLAPTQNNINVSLTVYPNSNSSSEIIHSCGVHNIPIQKWVNAIISVNNRSLDIYIDGKLVRTCMLPGVPKVSNKSNVLVTPGGGFSGYTSKLQYWDEAIDPQKAWNVYKLGYGDGFLSMFNAFEVDITVSNDGEEQASISF